MFVFVFSLLYCSHGFPSVSCFTEPFLVSVSYFSLSLVFSCCLVVWFLTLCLPFVFCLLLHGPLLVYLDYLSCQALWILFADRRPRPFTWVLICLALNIPFVRPCLFFWPCLRLKAYTWIRIPHVSFVLLQEDSSDKNSKNVLDIKIIACQCSVHGSVLPHVSCRVCVIEDESDFPDLCQE